jgi:hypothetical protein
MQTVKKIPSVSPWEGEAPAEPRRSKLFIQNGSVNLALPNFSQLPWKPLGVVRTDLKP